MCKPFVALWSAKSPQGYEKLKDLLEYCGHIRYAFVPTRQRSIASDSLFIDIHSQSFRVLISNLCQAILNRPQSCDRLRRQAPNSYLGLGLALRHIPAMACISPPSRGQPLGRILEDVDEADSITGSSAGAGDNTEATHSQDPLVCTHLSDLCFTNTV